MRFDVHGNTVRMASGTEQDFGRHIVCALDTGHILVVLLDPDDGPPMSENVFGLDDSARIVWRVQEFEFPNGRSPYTQISQSEDGSVKAYNFSGIMAVLEPQSGRITRSYLAK